MSRKKEIYERIAKKEYLEPDFNYQELTKKQLLEILEINGIESLPGILERKDVILDFYKSNFHDRLMYFRKNAGLETDTNGFRGSKKRDNGDFEDKYLDNNVNGLSELNFKDKSLKDEFEDCDDFNSNIRISESMHKNVNSSKIDSSFFTSPRNIFQKARKSLSRNENTKNNDIQFQNTYSNLSKKISPIKNSRNSVSPNKENISLNNINCNLSSNAFSFSNESKAQKNSNNRNASEYYFDENAKLYENFSEEGSNKSKSIFGRIKSIPLKNSNSNSPFLFENHLKNIPSYSFHGTSTKSPLKNNFTKQRRESERPQTSYNIENSIFIPKNEITDIFKRENSKDFSKKIIKNDGTVIKNEKKKMTSTILISFITAFLTFIIFIYICCKFFNHYLDESKNFSVKKYENSTIEDNDEINCDNEYNFMQKFLRFNTCANENLKNVVDYIRRANFENRLGLRKSNRIKISYLKDLYYEKIKMKKTKKFTNNDIMENTNESNYKKKFEHDESLNEDKNTQKDHIKKEKMHNNENENDKSFNEGENNHKIKSVEIENNKDSNMNKKITNEYKVDNNELNTEKFLKKILNSYTDIKKDKECLYSTKYKYNIGIIIQFIFKYIKNILIFVLTTFIGLIIAITLFKLYRRSKKSKKEKLIFIKKIEREIIKILIDQSERKQNKDINKARISIKQLKDCFDCKENIINISIENIKNNSNVKYYKTSKTNIDENELEWIGPTIKTDNSVYSG